MEGGEESAYWLKMMIETAKEELEILEAEYPNQFEFFKVHLKSFIPPLQNQNPTSSIATQASTTGIRRKTNSQGDVNGKKRRKMMSEDQRVEVVLEKAKECLQKINDLKIQLSSSGIMDLKPSRCQNTLSESWDLV